MAFINQVPSKNLVFTDFNNNTRPWRLNTTYLYHDPTLITDLSYLQPFSTIGADTNNMFIEAVDSDIKFVIDTSNKIEFNGYVDITDNLKVDNDISCNNLLVNSVLETKNNIISRNDIIIFNDISANNNLSITNDISCLNVLVNSNLICKNNIRSSNIYASADLSVNNNLFVNNRMEVTNDITAKTDISVNNNLYVGNNIDLSGNVTVFGDIFKVNQTNNTPERIFDASFEQLRIIINQLLTIEGLSTF